MSLTISERFLKHINLRTTQQSKNVDEPSKEDYAKAPDDFDSKLLDIIKKDSLTTRKDIQNAADGVKKTLGKETNIPLELRVGLQVVFKADDVEAAKKIFKQHFGKTPDAYIKSSGIKKSYLDAWERLYCFTAAPEETAKHRESSIQLIKLIYAIGYLADAKIPDDVMGFQGLAKLRLLIPKELFPGDKKIKKPNRNADKELLGHIKKLNVEIDLMATIKEKVTKEDKEFFTRGIGANIKPVLRSPLIDVPRASADESETVELEVKEPINWLVDKVEGEAKALSSGEDKNNLFTKNELEMLNKNKNILLGSSELDALNLIEKNIYEEAKGVIYHPKYAMDVKVMNHMAVKNLQTKLKLPLTKYPQKGFSSPMVTGSEPRVHQLGVGDLYVLEQQINRYEMGEVAHIENVMAKESRERVHTRINESENTYTTENEETVMDEKSLQTTDRYELSKESEKQVTASLEASAGFSVSAGYGPVSASANGNISSSTGASSSQSTSTAFSREMVEKSVSTITTRVREENISRVLNRIEEVNSHGFENDTDQNLCGIYRWVDKYYTVRTVNYGRRLMLEMVVPEPAAGFLYAEQMHPEHEEITPPPSAITFEPDDITRSNYMDYVAIYNATDVNAPPEQIVYKSVNLAKIKDDKYTYFADVDTSVTIDTGYKTTNFYGNYQYSYPSNKSDHSIDILVGNKRYGDTTVLPDVVGNVSISIKAHAISYHAGIRIRCELTDQAYQDWQIETWSALQTAYKASVAEYEGKVAAAAIGAGVDIHGLNPGQNEEIIRTELKRGAIKYLSDDMNEIIVGGLVRNNEVFDSADSTGDFDLDEAKVEGSIIQFFEQAFEWHNMMWKFYPYFWARTSEQHEKLLASDHDPIFRDFRRAGAARVVVPVPMEYQEAVLHFFETNEVWQGGETPILNDPEYISLVDDLKNGQLNSFNSPIYYQDEDSVPPYIVDEWEIKLPTSLVKLQDDSQLPNFATSLIETDAETLLGGLAVSSGFEEEWRNSIVNLLTLLGLDSSEASRRTLAEEKGYPCNVETDPIHNINEWLYDYLLVEISTVGLPS